MKKNTHPKYQQVLFVDSATGYKFVCGSTAQPQDTDTYQDKEYPAYRASVSSASHPFFTGSKQLVDSEGRVDKFNKRYPKKTLVKEEKEEQQPEGQKEEQQLDVQKKEQKKSDKKSNK
jgi:large subunit ribosomal protein L31